MIATQCRRRAPLIVRLARVQQRYNSSASSSASGHGTDVNDTRVFHFACTQCGKCCTGKGGRVRVNKRESQALQRALRMSSDELRAKYLTPVTQTSTTTGDEDESSAEPTWLIKQTDDDAQCIFLQGTKCSVYEARPTQCRTFPWWPQHLISDYDWQLAARHCEGITTGTSTGSDVSRRASYTLQDVLPETIVYDIHRAGENYTYDELHAMLRDLQDADTSFLDEYADELRSKFHRRVVFRDARVTVLDTFLDGMPPTRCFVFNDRLHLVQSEMNLADDGASLDASVLVLDVHRVMSHALLWLASRKDAQWKIAVLGSGGGSLVRFIDHAHADSVATIDAVEPDAIVNDIAKRFFGLEALASLTLHEQFGEAFVAQQLDEPTNFGAYDFFFIDVEAGASSNGVLALPASMLTETILRGVATLLSDVGVVAINVITEDDHALRDVAAKVQKAVNAEIETALYVKLPKNTVLFLAKDAPSLSVLQALSGADDPADRVDFHQLSELL